MLIPGFTCSNQDVGVSQQGEHWCAFGALQDGKGGLSSEPHVYPWGIPGWCMFLQGSMHLLHSHHQLTYGLTSGEILEGCSVQSCRAGKQTWMLACFWRQHRSNPHFPIAFPSARLLPSREFHGDTATVFGSITEGGEAAPSPAPIGESSRTP